MRANFVIHAANTSLAMFVESGQARGNDCAVCFSTICFDFLRCSCNIKQNYTPTPFVYKHGPPVGICVKEPIMDPPVDVCVREPIMDPLP